VLQTAAVIGKTFPEPLLRQVIGSISELGESELSEALSALATAEFLFEASLYPQLEYSFKHPLTQEVAQGSQLRERRVQVHAAVAKALEEASDDQDERAGEIAQHWAEAGNSGRAAHWYRRAAEWAGLSDPREGLRHWRRVRELAPGIADESERDELALQACVQLFLLGWRMGGSESEAEAVFAQGRALAERIGDRHALAMLVGFYGLMRAQLAGSALDYVRYGEEAAEIAAEIDDPALRAGIGTFPAFGNFYVGDGRATLEWSSQVLAEVGSDDALGKEIAGYGPRAAMLFARACALITLGRFEEAPGAAGEASRAAEDAQEFEVLGWVQYAWTTLAFARGGPESALEHGNHCLAIAEKLDNGSSRALAYLSLGQAYLIDAQLSAAREVLGLAAATIRDQAVQLAFLPQVLALQAEVHLGLGEPTEALAAAREAIERGSITGCNYFEAQAQIALVAILLATDDVVPHAEIESALERAEELVESLEARSLSPRILELRGRLASALGDEPASDGALHQALDLYRTLGATGHAERLAGELSA
jgi:adenylate cyclase